MNFVFMLFSTIIFMVLFSGCSGPVVGITKLDDFNNTISDSKHQIPDMQYQKAVKKERAKLKNRNEIRSLTKSMEKKIKVKTFSNLDKLGVINITSRLKGPLAKHTPLEISTVEKKSHFVKRVDSNKDRFGGKLICNVDVLTFRIDRTNFIECQESYLDKVGILDYSLDDILIDWKMVSIINVLKEDIKPGCNLIYAASLQSYHEMAQCLIDDLTKHGFFKFRNVNSLGSKFNIIKQ